MRFLRQIKLHQAIFLLVLAYTLPLHAVDKKELFQAQVPVMTKDDSEKNQAVKQALAQVFVKLSGNQAVATLPVLRSSLEQAERMLLQYGYTPDASGQAWILHARFDPKRVLALLDQAEQPIWSESRPTIALWVAQSKRGGLEWIGAANHSFISESVRQVARERGVPIVLPLLDLTDMQLLPTHATAEIDSTPIRQASRRYGAHLSLLGRVEQDTSSGEWYADWELPFSRDPLHWRERGSSAEAVVTAGFNTAIDALVSRYMGDNYDDQREWLLRVNNVNSIQDYTRLTQNLQALSVIQSLKLFAINQDEVQYQLKINGSGDDLARALDELNELSAVHDAAEHEPYQLHYQLRS